MSAATSVISLVEGFPAPSPPKNDGKPNYVCIKDTHQIMTENAKSVDKALIGVYNGYLYLILLTIQHVRLVANPFKSPEYTGLTYIVPAKTPSEE